MKIADARLNTSPPTPPAVRRLRENLMYDGRDWTVFATHKSPADGCNVTDRDGNRHRKQ